LLPAGYGIIAVAKAQRILYGGLVTITGTWVAGRQISTAFLSA
jgi:hypothetical protein